MQIAMIGLGRMGMNMAKRLLQGGHSVIAYNRTPNKTDQLVKEGAIGAYSLGEVVEKLSPPRVTWVMLPAGPTVDDHIVQLKEILSPGDIVIEGGNTYYRCRCQWGYMGSEGRLLSNDWRGKRNLRIP